jgi:DNA-binding XRE family transcriptional regulator
MQDAELVARLSELAERVRLRDGLPEPDERRRIREAAGVSQEDLAEAIGIGRRTLIDYEHGRHAPAEAQLTRYLVGLRACRKIAAERQKSTTEAEAGHALASPSLR